MKLIVFLHFIHAVTSFLYAKWFIHTYIFDYCLVLETEKKGNLWIMKIFKSFMFPTEKLSEIWNVGKLRAPPSGTRIYGYDCDLPMTLFYFIIFPPYLALLRASGVLRDSDIYGYDQVMITILLLPPFLGRCESLYCVIIY